MKYISLLFIACCLCTSGFAQKKNASYQLQISRATSPIQIDGVMDEPAWQAAKPATNFYMVLPMDTSHAKVKTEVRMTYDDTHLYLIATCYKAVAGEDMVESMRRDFAFLKNDNFLIFIDPFNDQTSGFCFGANAAGAQCDGLMYEGGKVDWSWDNKWTSEVKSDPEKWVFEAAIPFKTMRFKDGVDHWGVNFGRNDLKTTEKSAWAPVPRQFPTASLAYTGSIVWDKAPPAPKTNISVIPYILGGVSKDYENKTPTDFKKSIGGDIKISITPSLNLDLTLNPDFSQVDVDVQVANLSRFELFFPERRQFFLENGDLFGNFGYSTIRPFFSRRIGLTTPIAFGARLSGKLDANWRIGVMDMQTEKDISTGLPQQNFAVLSLQRKVFARSSIGLLVVNKQSLNYQPDTAASATKYNAYNRDIGFEYNLASKNNTWTGKAIAMESFSPGQTGNNFVHAANLIYSTRKWNISWQHEAVGQHFTAEAGYVPRTGYEKINPAISRLFFPANGPILTHGPTLSSFYYWNQSFQKTDENVTFSYNIVFRSRATLSLWTANDYILLQTPFDPTNFNGATLKTGTASSWNSYGSDFLSKPQSLFTYGLSTRFGGYYVNGSRTSISGQAGFRFQPYVSITANFSYNNIQLPQPWGDTHFWLVGPRLDVTLTNKFFITAFAQYNEQLKNFNINTRLQWRYRPASDLFIVYTDNYLPDVWTVKNRALVLKWTYWWSL